MLGLKVMLECDSFHKLLQSAGYLSRITVGIDSLQILCNCCELGLNDIIILFDALRDVWRNRFFQRAYSAENSIREWSYHEKFSTTFEDRRCWDC